MTAVPVGKLPAALLTRLLARFPTSPEVVLGPSTGEDAAAIEFGSQTLVAATDPITLTSAGAGRLAVVINANDVAVSGARPRWFLASVLFPEGTHEAEIEALFAGIAEGLDAV